MERSEKLVTEIESLPIDLRTKLIDRLLEGLSPSSKEIELAWQEEVEKRVKEIRSGKVKTIPGDQVFSEIKARLAK